MKALTILLAFLLGNILAFALVKNQEKFPWLPKVLLPPPVNEELLCRDQVYNAMDIATKICFYGTRK